MNTVTSKDGTRIAYDRLGTGPAVILINGGPTDRRTNAPLADLLQANFTVINYDRRNRGDSGSDAPSSIDHEIDDLAAVLGAAGDQAFVFGSSGGAVLALQAARVLPFARLAVWEPPFIVPGTRAPVPDSYLPQLTELLGEGRRGDAVALFMTQAVGVPAEFVDQMRHAPFWASLEGLAHTLVTDAALMGDWTVPTGQLADVRVPTLVLDGGASPAASRTSARAVTAALPQAQHQSIEGQEHNVAPEAIAPVLRAFFTV